MLRLIGINLAVLAVLLVGIEGAVRVVVSEAQPMGTSRALVADSVYGAVAGLAASAQGRTNGVPVATTAHRTWRYAGDLAGPLDADAPAWLLLGDSVTMGLGVEADSTVGGRLAAASALRVLNPSVPGYGADDYLTVGAAWLRATPGIERVTVVWCLNDAYRHTPSAPPPGLGLGQVGDAVMRFLRRHVRTYAVAKANLADRPATYLPYDRRFYDGTLPDSTAALDDAADALAELAALADSAGARFEIVVVPYEAQLRHDPTPEAFVPQTVFAERLHARGLPLADATPAFLAARSPARDASRLYLYGDGIHLSARGHGVLAEALAE